MRRIIPFVFTTLAALGSAACDENLSTIAGPDTPNLTPAFSAIQRDIFDAPDASGRRACTSCHTTVNRVPAGVPAGRLLLTGSSDEVYDRLVGRNANFKPGAIYVVPGDPDNSYVVQKIEGAPGIAGVRMPFGGPYLHEGQIQIIRRWIEIGAPRN
jgi:hypothetical protein